RAARRSAHRRIRWHLPGLPAAEFLQERTIMTALATGLAATKLSVGYGAQPVLSDLDFTVPEGRFTAVIGPNGCGKSTLVKSLSRVLATQPGMVHFQGTPLQKLRPKHLAQRIALLPQHPVVPETVTLVVLSALSLFTYHCSLRLLSVDDPSAIVQALEDTGVSPFAQFPVAHLFDGQRQRAWLAMVSAQQPHQLL